MRKQYNFGIDSVNSAAGHCTYFRLSIFFLIFNTFSNIENKKQLEISKLSVILEIWELLWMTHLFIKFEKNSKEGSNVEDT